MEGTRDDREEVERAPRKRIWWIVGGVAGGILALYGVAVILVHVLVDPATLANWVQPRVESALNRSVEVEGARVRLFPALGAEVQGLRVENLASFDGPPLAQIGAVRLDVAILPLFTGRIRVNEVRVIDPVVHLGVNEEGVTNYGDLVPEAGEDPSADGEEPLEFAVREVRLEGGRISYSNLRDTLAFMLGGLAARADLERSDEGWAGGLEAATDSLVVGLPGRGEEPLTLVGPAVQARATAGGEFEWVQIQEGTLGLGDARVGLRGRIDRLKEPVRELDLALSAESLEIQRLLEVLPPATVDRLRGEGSGVIALDIEVRGPVGPDAEPEVGGEVQLRDVGFQHEEGEVLASGLEGQIDIREGQAETSGIRGELLGGPFVASGLVRRDDGFPFAALVEARPRLEPVSALMPPGEGGERARLEGVLAAEVQLDGLLRDPSTTRVDGFATAEGVRIELPTLASPVTVASARADFADGGATWNDVVIEADTDRLRTSGTVDDLFAILTPPGAGTPTMDVQFSSSRIHLDRWLVSRGDSSVTYGKMAFARLGNREIQGRTAEAWAAENELALPDSLAVSGVARIQLDTLISPPYTLTDLDARAEFSPGLVEVPDATFDLYGGQVASTMRLGVGGDDPEPFTFTMDAQDVRAADFLAATSPLGRNVRGTLTLQLDAGGALDRTLLPIPASLGGSGELQIEDGGLEDNPLTRALADALSISALASPSFSDWTAALTFDGSSITFAESSLATVVGTLLYGGSVGFDGSLDLGVRMALPADRLDSLALGRSGLAEALAGRLTGGSSPVSLGLGIEGTIEDPSIGPRASLASGELRETLQSEAEGRVTEVRDSAAERLDQVRDSVERRIEAERSEVEEEARERTEDARRDLQDRARSLLRGLTGTEEPTDSAAPDTTSPDTADPREEVPDEAPPDTASPSGGR